MFSVLKIRRRAWAAAALAAIAVGVAGIASADQLLIDGDVATAGTNSPLIVSADPGSTVTTTVGMRIGYSGSKHLVQGSSVSFAVNSAQTTLPSGYSVGSTASLTIPSGAGWNDNSDETGSVTSAISFTAPQQPGQYTYAVKWTPQNLQCASAGCLNEPALSIQLTVNEPSAPADTTAPTSSATATKGTLAAPYAFGNWTNEDVSVSLTGLDEVGGSGLQSIRYTLDGSDPTASNGSDYTGPIAITAEGVTTVKYYATDVAGNEESPVNSAVVKIDKTAPSVQCGSADGAWHGSEVSIACTATDGASGLSDQADSSFDLVTNVGAGNDDGNASTGSRTVYDVAGNPSAAGPVSGNKVDRKNPSASLSCPSSVLLHSTASATLSASDTGSGLDPNGLQDGATISLATGSVGPKQSGTVTVSDAVGNSATAAACSYSVIYDWSGFFRPVDNLPVVNAVKAGSAVPVKFSLGGDQGLGIMAAGYPQSGVIACASSAEVDNVETTVTAGGSSLSYDAAAGQYTYVWKTDKAWAGTCRQLVVKLADGTYHRANFKLLK